MLTTILLSTALQFPPMPDDVQLSIATTLPGEFRFLQNNAGYSYRQEIANGDTSFDIVMDAVPLSDHTRRFFQPGIEFIVGVNGYYDSGYGVPTDPRILGVNQYLRITQPDFSISVDGGGPFVNYGGLSDWETVQQHVRVHFEPGRAAVLDPACDCLVPHFDTAQLAVLWALNPIPEAQSWAYMLLGLFALLLRQLSTLESPK